MYTSGGNATRNASVVCASLRIVICARFTCHAFPLEASTWSFLSEPFENIKFGDTAPDSFTTLQQTRRVKAGWFATVRYCPHSESRCPANNDLVLIAFERQSFYGSA